MVRLVVPIIITATEAGHDVPQGTSTRTTDAAARFVLEATSGFPDVAVANLLRHVAAFRKGVTTFSASHLIVRKMAT